jgi:hypothetical protein
VVKNSWPPSLASFAYVKKSVVRQTGKADDFTEDNEDNEELRRMWLNVRALCDLVSPS